ncbi:MAG: YifB family Mg chelatase-like AAA ATPase [Desulfurivibrionaceae bacterium]
MLARVLSSSVQGIDAVPVEVEVDLVFGLPNFATVGLPEGAVRESKDRVRAAIKNSGYQFPNQKITVNLAPADIKKSGTGFDLPMAVGILTAAEICNREYLDHYCLIGELSLDGRLRPVQGILPMMITAREQGLKGAVIPSANAREAEVVRDLDIIAVDHLHEAVNFLADNSTIAPLPGKLNFEEQDRENYSLDFCEVKGHDHVKRALEVAAAGSHNILMKGPPGSGKTMLARRLPTILPDLSFEEALATTKIFSVSGLMTEGCGLIRQRPFRSPHHTISDAGLIGGGHNPRPGEVSLAHNGVLFLDEMPEFRKAVLEVLRQPLEDETVTIARAATTLTFPARFMMVAAYNPCPCGYLGDRHHNCTCTPSQVKRYEDKLSGPLLDRIDMHLEVEALTMEELGKKTEGESSAEIKKRVEKARGLQQERFKNDNIFDNGSMGNREIKKFCSLDSTSTALLEKGAEKLGLSARAYHRILKMARTIADLEESENIASHHIAEAIQYRRL